MSPYVEDEMEPGDVLACPHCDAGGLRKLKHNGQGRPPEHDSPYKCKECCEPVEEPVIRRSKKGRPDGMGLADMDPEDLPGLSGGEKA